MVFDAPLRPQHVPRVLSGFRSLVPAFAEDHCQTFSLTQVVKTAGFGF